MRALPLALLAILALFPAFTLVATRVFPGGNETAAAQGAQLRIVLPMVSRDVLPDLIVESITVTRSDITSADYRYRIRNVGDASADLPKFTMQAWFSADAALDKGVDLEAGIVAFTIVLAPGAVLEAEATAGEPAASISSYPYLILELNSAGSVVESNAANNAGSTRRPPLDLVGPVQLAWDNEADAATITWEFRGETYGIADEGWRVDVPGFGIQELPPGSRRLSIPFNPFTGARPCIARVTALRDGLPPWPTIESNRLCQ
jgi:hypothetical protein